MNKTCSVLVLLLTAAAAFGQGSEIPILTRDGQVVRSATPYTIGEIPQACDGSTICLKSTGLGDITDVWTCPTGNCDDLTAAAGDTFDAGAADYSRPAVRTATLPPTCVEGDLVHDTDSGGTELHNCTATDTFTRLGRLDQLQVDDASLSTGPLVSLLGSTQGIDTSIIGDTILIDWDSREVAGRTFAPGTNASFTWTFDVTGAVDPAWTFSDGLIDVSAGKLREGGFDVVTSPNTSVAGNEVVRMDGTTGDKIKKSDVTVSDAGTFDFPEGTTDKLLLYGLVYGVGIEDFAHTIWTDSNGRIRFRRCSAAPCRTAGEQMASLNSSSGNVGFYVTDDVTGDIDAPADVKLGARDDNSKVILHLETGGSGTDAVIQLKTANELWSFYNDESDAQKLKFDSDSGTMFRLETDGDAVLAQRLTLWGTSQTYTGSPIGITLGGTHKLNAANLGASAVVASSIFDVDVASTFPIAQTFVSQHKFRIDTDINYSSVFWMADYFANSRYEISGAANIGSTTFPPMYGLLAYPQFIDTNSGDGTMTVPEYAAVYARGVSASIPAAVTITNWHGFAYDEPAGAGSIVTQKAVEVPRLTRSGTVNIGIENAGTEVYPTHEIICASTGDASPCTVTVTPTAAKVRIVCQDNNSCDVTLGETNIPDGQEVRLTCDNDGTAGRTCDFADTSGVTELAGAFSANRFGSLKLIYDVDRWLETGRSQNS